MINNKCLNPNSPPIPIPIGLFNKVQFDIRFYFSRRGCENMQSMKKDDFVIRSDQSGNRYVCKRNDAEMTKNHRQNDVSSSGDGYMPESRGNQQCPVLSFEKYLSKLSELNRLWQMPKASFLDTDATWYTKRPVGERKLRDFMPKLSMECNLSQRYTNHCLRATNATILKRSNFSDAQVCAVTGHKSAHSLAVYQRVSVPEKMQMGKALENVLAPPQSEVLQSKLVDDEDEWADMDISDFDTYVKGVGPSRAFNQCKFQKCTISVTINMAK